ncbi:MAG TPA: CocE/NonD family hydrolase, partial [Bryobacterales bacterium]|nr:CocE/NonD family hydrolase [Bryobacterales bacterium]
SANARARSGPSEKDSVRFDPGTADGYKFFLALGPVSNVDKLYFHNQVPEWNNYMEHPDYDEFWQRQNVAQYLKNITVPVLNVAGWFDAEDFYGPMSIYEEIEKTTPSNHSTLVVGPFSHGGWNGEDTGNALRNIRFAGSPAVYFRDKVQFPFFLYYLKQKGGLHLPEALVYETGSNVWRSYDHWPPRQASDKSLYFRAGGKLAFDPPSDAGPNAYDSYISDPARPVPFSAETRFSQGHLWMVEDQRFAAHRPDVLVYETAPLSEDVTVAGRVIAKLYAATSGTDSDFIAKLIDVYPGTAPDNDPNPAGIRMGDFQMLVSGEVFRARYRHSFTHPEPLVPNQPTAIEINLRDKNHRFLRGHEIMVQVQSTWFPVIDRNPQKFVNIYQATPADFQKAEQRIYRSREFPSHVEVSILGVQ